MAESGRCRGTGSRGYMPKLLLSHLVAVHNPRRLHRVRRCPRVSDGAAAVLWKRTNRLGIFFFTTAPNLDIGKMICQIGVDLRRFCRSVSRLQFSQGYTGVRVASHGLSGLFAVAGGVSPVGRLHARPSHPRLCNRYRLRQELITAPEQIANGRMPVRE